MGKVLGADDLDSIVNPAGILGTARQGDRSRLAMLRVNTSGVRLSMLAGTMELVGQAEEHRPSADEIESQLRDLKQRPRNHSTLTTAVAVGLACAAFGVIFGGTAREFGIVLFTATLAQLLRHRLSSTRLRGLLTTAIVAAFASLVAWVLGGESFRITVSASVLLLVPGVPLVGATSELFRGDVTAGLSRVTSAMSTVVMAGAGIWCAMLIMGVERAPGPGLPGQESLLIASLMGGLAAAGFAVLFDVPTRHLPWAAVTGVLAVGTRNLALDLGAPVEGANAMAGLVIGLAADQLSRIHRVPYLLYAVPGYIPLVPGTVFFGGVVALVHRDYVAGLSDLVRGQLILVAIAVGMGCVSVMFRERGRGEA